MNELRNYQLSKNPYDNFHSWHTLAKQTLGDGANQMVLSTVDKNHHPDARMVLLKAFDTQKYGFFTNYLSKKALQLENNPHACLTFWWAEINKQVIIRGEVQKMSLEESQTYFESRAHGSQVASYTSEQSQPIESGEELLRRFNKNMEKFKNSVPYPKNWGGYWISPYFFEFFLYQDNRLNDRFQFQKNEQNWKIQRVQP